ncbi:ROK family protein [Marinilabilia rubra]|uniref:ROK family protein n=1 Tax=Marinilabilia rubra TaxID=2162893 RepID=A0A2U2BC17_9BACT|nr:ROK family protein [Marinilabilia rubra]PWE00608.1 ROK family protein [Marinilabilia rubra]
MSYLVADLGGTRIKAGVFQEKKIIASSILNTDNKESFSKVIENLDGVFEELITSVNCQKSEINGLGLALPGIVDIDRNHVLAINDKYNESIHFNFDRWARDKWNAVLATDNDARAALAGIWQYGVGKGYDNIITMTLGTGVGGAALINGKFLYGKHYQAGCLGGHSTVNFDSFKCNCGNMGCVEALGSTWNLNNIVQSHPDIAQSSLNNYDNVDFAVLFDEYRMGDTVSKEVTENVLKAWSSGAVNLIHAYDPELLVLSGGVMKSADIIVPFMQNWINKHAWTPWGKVQIKISQAIDDIALLGLGYLVDTKIKNKRKN